MGEIFKCMFPDSKVHRHFSMGRTKCLYVKKFGLGPFFQEELVEKVKKSPFFSISFDESLNETLKKQQMDFVVSYWDYSQSEVERGFSSNKGLLNDNMKEKTVVARRCIKDHIQTFQLKPHQVKITK